MARKNKKLLSEGQVRQFMKLANLGALNPGFIHGLHEQEGLRIPKGHDPDALAKPEQAIATTGASKLDMPATNLTPKVPSTPKPPRALQQRNPEAGMKRESHGRGADEGDAGYGHPDARQRPAGARLREQDEDLENMDMEFEDEEVEDIDMGLEDEDLEGELEGPPEGGREVSIDDFLVALERALEDVMGEEVEVSQDDEEGLEDEELEADLEGDELDLELEDEELALQEKKQGADDREDEHLGAKDGKEADKKQSEKDRRKEMRGATKEGLAMEALVGKITRRVAERLVREKLTGKK
tara:strand:+ start:1505 stop:2398 length:894 start_codon:yes stop_codon:yes gene_type:complete